MNKNILFVFILFVLTGCDTLPENSIDKINESKCNDSIKIDVSFIFDCPNEYRDINNFIDYLLGRNNCGKILKIGSTCVSHKVNL